MTSEYISLLKVLSVGYDTIRRFISDWSDVRGLND